MNIREKLLLDTAIEYKEDYYKCPWWKFKKRSKLYRRWQNTLDLIIKDYN